MDLVDAHVHFWDPARLSYPWLAEVPAFARSFVPQDLDTGGHRITAAVFVEAGRLGEQAEDEVGWVAELAAGWPALRAVVAHADLERGPAGLSRWDDHDLVRGIRRNLQDEPAGFALADAFVDGVRGLAGRGRTFDLCIRHHQLPEVTELVRRVPQVTFVLDHVAKPPIAARAADPWREHLARLGDAPNVVCKLSGLTTEAGVGWASGDVLPYLKHALAVFGPDRCMFGGDWPVSTPTTSYRRWVDAVAAATTGLSEADRRAVFTETAARVYRL